MVINMATNFKTGQKIYPLVSSNDVYGVTNLKRGGWGVVHGMVGGEVVIDWYHANGRKHEDSPFHVDPQHFADDKVGAAPKVPGVKIAYEPGTSVIDYVRKLLKIETDPSRKKWLQTFDNCVLPPEVRTAVDEALTVILQAHKFQEWGINEHFEKGLTNSILLYGPPGTGKTMISESIAAVLGKNLMIVSSGEIQSPMPGQTEKNIKQAFATAKTNNAVVLFDECDSILSDRNMVGVILGAEINCLLQELERFDGVCILTTNRLHRLDPALARRIIATVELLPPGFEARKQIWEKLLPPKMPVENLDHAKLAEYVLTGGEIKNAVLLSARKAIAQAHDKVTMKHLTDAVEAVLKTKRSYESSRPKRVQSEMIHSSDADAGFGMDKDKAKAPATDVDKKRTTRTGFAAGW